MAKGRNQVEWEFFGELLRERREAAELSRNELGTLVFVSGTYIGLFEQGVRKPQLDLAKGFDVVLKTEGIFERTWRKLIDKSPYAVYFQAAADLEDQATAICEFEPMVVPGLLQTAAYARTLTRASNPFATDEFVEEKVTSRLARQSILRDANRPTYWVIMHESTLRIPVGGPAVMAEQLKHILAQVREHRVLVQVVPFAAGAHPEMGASIKLMEFEDMPPTAYTEALFSGNLLDDPALVKQVQAAYDLLRAAALSPEASLALLESAAEEYRQCASTT
ncbi:helix-turn-helix domain-containing protein [Streptomyces laurentii]|uniref:helix-turn-helix domain-containing protein n=1 Tax=Streptomyces laurentii TaxID=39478 RepID=UPI0033C2E879